MDVAMRALMAAALCAAAVSRPAPAQLTLDLPTGEFRPWHSDSGLQRNAGNAPAAVHGELVRVEDAAWLRLYFDEISLARGSFVRVTSLLDGEVQELDAAEAAMWGFSTAYFNGDAVRVELVAGPGTSGNRYAIGLLGVGAHPAQPVGGCGICATDKRVSSSETWTARLLPAGCTASVYNEQSCLVSAGHCMGGNMVVQFNVPPSNPNCTLNNPPVADQFPVTGSSSNNGGVGQDWAVMTSGTNNMGQTIFSRYGTLRPIATTPPVNGQAIDVWGYGADDTCTLSQTQQTDDGNVGTVFGTWFEHTVDITFGSSGSAVIRNGEILGIVTHCPCPNVATRIDHPSFVAARNSLCGQPQPPVNDECDAAIDLGIVAPVSDDFNNAGATSGPDGAPFLDPACDQFGDSPGILSDLWWLWTAPGNGSTRFHTCGAGLDTKLAVYVDAGCPVAEASEIACSDDGDCPGGGSESDVTIPVGGGTTYRVRVGRWGTDGGNQGPAGDGTLFIEFTPDLETGACCLGEDCFVLTSTDCAKFGGAYQGNDAPCSPDPCGPPTGACCVNDLCLVLVEATCTGVGGEYQGDGASCTPDPCLPRPPECPWDCEASPDGSIAINDLLALLSQWGAAGPCDFDGGSVGINDLLKLLSNWGSCP